MLPSPDSAPVGGAAAPKKLKRPRAVQACNLCRAKKYKCDGAYPCSHCRKYGSECVFRSAQPGGVLGPYSATYVKELERRLKDAEAAVSALKPPQSQSGNAEAGESSTTPKSLASAERQSAQVLASFGRRRDFPSASTATGQAEDAQEDMVDDPSTEVVDINPHTNALEFHGHTSSVAFLGRVRQEFDDGKGEQHQPRASIASQPSLITAFNNERFLPQRDDLWSAMLDEQLFSPRFYVFLDTYFKNLHYIHPILDPESFYHRCEDLWQGHPERQSRSFIALYYSLLSLGALVRSWGDEKINGLGRFDWCRRLFRKAQIALGEPGYINDLEAIQTLFVIVKICQNELNPNLAYTYLGMAIRKCLSTGINRKGSSGDVDEKTALAISKTWWGLYSLEIELSFALGRPDTLGLDDYHNVPTPPVNGTSDSSILTCMLGLSQIMRATSVSVYLSNVPLAEKLNRALQLETEMDAWVEGLPDEIRPRMTQDASSNINSLRDPHWARLQRLVLQIRYWNVKMLLLRPFLIHSAKVSLQSRPLPQDFDVAVTKCVEAAASTINIIYDTCRVHNFFRTWWYNTTYIIFAASILLFRAAQPSCPDLEYPSYLSLLNRSLDILEAMDESIVARNTADVVRQMVMRLRERIDVCPATCTSRVLRPVRPIKVSGPGSVPVVEQAADPFLFDAEFRNMEMFGLGQGFFDGGLLDSGPDLSTYSWEFSQG